MRDRQLDRYVAAGMAAVQVEAVDAERIERLQMAGDEIAERGSGLARRGRVAVAERVGRDHAAPRGEYAEQRLEHLRRAGRRMQHHQRHAARTLRPAWR
jgi:hypothetical protein